MLAHLGLDEYTKICFALSLGGSLARGVPDEVQALYRGAMMGIIIDADSTRAEFAQTFKLLLALCAIITAQSNFKTPDGVTLDEHDDEEVEDSSLDWYEPSATTEENARQLRTNVLLLMRSPALNGTLALFDSYVKGATEQYVRDVVRLYTDEVFPRFTVLADHVYEHATKH